MRAINRELSEKRTLNNATLCVQDTLSIRNLRDPLHACIFLIKYIVVRTLTERLIRVVLKIYKA